MTTIKGNNDGPGGRNETYNVGKRKNVPRAQVVKEIEQGKHPDAHVVTHTAILPCSLTANYYQANGKSS